MSKPRKETIGDKVFDWVLIITTIGFLVAVVFVNLVIYTDIFIHLP